MRWGVLFTGLWATAAATVWWLNVPFAPEYVLSGVSSPFQINAHEMLTSTRVPKSEPNPRTRNIGPIEIRDVQTGRVLRSYLDANWTVVAFDVESRERLAVRNGEVIRVLRASDGTVLCEIDPIAEPASASFAAAGKLLLVEDAGAASAHDAETGQLKWTKENAVPTRLWVGPNLVAMTKPPASNVPKGTPAMVSRRSSQLFDWETGEEYQPLKGNHSMTMLGSRDGRFIFIREGGTWGVFNATSGELLWQLPKQALNILWFNEDGSELHVPYRFKDGPAGVARWKSEDGTVLSPLPKGAGNADLKISADGRYAYERRQHFWLPLSVSVFFRSWKLWKLGDLTGPVVAPVIIDLEQQKILGRLPPDEQYALQIPGPGFLCYDKNGMGSSYYSFPPGRNWSWLFTWAIGPPAAVWSLTGVRRRWRAARTTATIAA